MCHLSCLFHYCDAIMGTIASQITSLTIVYTTVYSEADQSKHRSSASLAFVWGIHRDRWIPRTKGQLRGKCFHLMTSSCKILFKSFTFSFAVFQFWIVYISKNYSIFFQLCGIYWTWTIFAPRTVAEDFLIAICRYDHPVFSYYPQQIGASVCSEHFLVHDVLIWNHFEFTMCSMMM